METLKIWSYKNVQGVSLDFKRHLINQINWQNRLIILIGSRGVGKTTLMLQTLKEKKITAEEGLYLSLDSVYFANHSLLTFAEEFVQIGGKYLFLDEIQKYKNWSIEVKNIYDNYPELNMVLSGSSATEILKSEGDLSRRALFYRLGGLSYREYLNYQLDKKFEPISLLDITNNHTEISYEISTQIKPLKEFKEYLNYGYYPFFKEDVNSYHHRLRQVINTVIEVDIPTVYAVDYAAVQNIKKLLSIISEIVPFKPNIKKLSEQIGISRESLIKYLKYIENADLVSLLYSENRGISLLNKPEKIYLNNTNISYALNNHINIGNARETFFINQLKLNHEVRFSTKGDFKIDNDFIFEIGGKDKNIKQIGDQKNAWIVADNIEISVNNKIPLWLFGFLY